MSTTKTEPMFLKSVDGLQAHIQEHFSQLASTDKGTRFAEFAAKLIETLPDLEQFGPIRLSQKKSHDGGVDGSSEASGDGLLHMQSKLSITTKEDIDSVLSKFQALEHATLLGPKQKSLSLEQAPSSAPSSYVIVTSVRLKGIMDRYKAVQMSSRAFYDKLVAAGRLHIVDGDKVFTAVRAAYSRAFGAPNVLELTSPGGWIRSGNVRLGFLKASDLVKLFDVYSDGLFYENVRDWLGPMSGKKAPDQLTVNQEIAQTISKSPERFLERNNGITFKAKRVVPKNGAIELQEASVVNGCQTTMALVKAASSVDACLVQVKVVESDDAWDVAKAANYQNPVAKINLELAPYIRPQLVRQAAAEAGVRIDDVGADNAVSLLNSLYDDRLQYEELRFLYIGLLSISPNNIIDQIYTSLRDDLLTGFAQTEADRGLMMDCMFQLTLQTRKIVTEAKSIFGSEEAFGPFMRIFEQEKPQYRMFLSIVAISALVGIDVSERLVPGKELNRMRSFLQKAQALLQSEPNRFRTAYLKAVSALATGAREGPEDDAKVRQRLSGYVGRAYRQLYLSLTAQLAVDRAIDGGD